MHLTIDRLLMCFPLDQRSVLSQMNENFNFLASEIREKEVNCNNGETISDAINEGYNSLTIYGTCDGGLMVYMFDPNPFE